MNEPDAGYEPRLGHECDSLYDASEEVAWIVDGGWDVRLWLREDAPSPDERYGAEASGGTGSDDAHRGYGDTLPHAIGELAYALRTAYPADDEEMDGD